MLLIKYDTSYKGHSFEIVWNDDNRSSNSEEYVNIRRKNIHEDIEIAQTKLRAIRLLWNTNTVIVRVSPGFLKEDVATKNWVLCEVLKGFISTKTIIIFGTKGMDVSIPIIQKVFAARILGMIPANVATPTYMANTAKRYFEKHKRCKVRIFHHTDLVKHGFGLILGIGDSARRTASPTFVFIERKGTKQKQKDGPKVAIIGKGVTFDSGGLALKPFKYMADMKYDKIGAAYGLVTLQHLIEDPRWDHVTFYGAFPFAENAISHTSLHPGDVIRSFIGKTVEVANPDAEGRLIMADAMGYLHKYKPDFVMDVASLTGHASYINCWHHAYYYANTPDLKRRVEEIGEKNGERVLPMPTWSGYDKVLKSLVADLNNSPRECGDSFIAALFLKQFVPPKAKWVHFDLANDLSQNGLPNGNSIRTMIAVIENYLSKK